MMRWTRAVVRGVAFWTAVLLPLAYLPLVIAGVPPIPDPSVLAILVAVNVLALVLGRSYDGASRRRVDGTG